MRKLVFALLGLCILASGVMAAPPNHVNTKVFLTEKTPTDTAPATLWNLKQGGYGYLTYRVWGPEFSFQFQGKKLERNTPYALIYYPDPWPGTGLIILAEGTSNGGGNILLKGKMDTGTLPANDIDENFPGAKIWLVPNPSLYISGNAFTDWPPAGEGILFETALINYYKN